MPPFRIILLTSVLVSVCLSQETAVTVHLKGDIHPFEVTSPELLSKEMKLIQDYSLKEGKLNIIFECIEINKDEKKKNHFFTQWKVENSSFVYIDSVVVRGSSEIKPTTLFKFFRSLQNQVASFHTLEKATNLMQSYRFFETVNPPFYARYGSGEIAVVVPVKTNFTNFVTGAFGYAPRFNDSPQLTGEIQIHLENLSETASIADLFWLRKDEQSQILSLSYEEPFLWRFSLGVGFTFFQNLQDGLYVRRRTRISVVKPNSSLGKWLIGGERIAVTVTPEGDSLGLFDYEVNSLVIENVWERRNSTWNPSRGFFLKWGIELGDYMEPPMNNVILYRGQIEFEIIHLLKKRLALSLHGLGGYVGLSRNQSVPQSELFWIGGATTLRGYREQAFQTNWMELLQLELRYQLGRFNRMYLFSDAAFQNEILPIPLSVGIGIQQKTPLGVLRIDYALNRDDRPSNGKIHIRLVGEF